MPKLRGVQIGVSGSDFTSKNAFVSGCHLPASRQGKAGRRPAPDQPRSEVDRLARPRRHMQQHGQGYQTIRRQPTP